MSDMGNLYVNLGGYFTLCFIITYADNLDTNLEVSFYILIIAEEDSIFRKQNNSISGEDDSTLHNLNNKCI